MRATARRVEPAPCGAPVPPSAFEPRPARDLGPPWALKTAHEIPDVTPRRTHGANAFRLKHQSIKSVVLYNVIKDNNIKRPFIFIPLGGSTNGSTLEGHNYTYVGSQWGRIVDILIETKCMNPIIYFDELDKITVPEKKKNHPALLKRNTHPDPVKKKL